MALSTPPPQPPDPTPSSSTTTAVATTPATTRPPFPPNPRNPPPPPPHLHPHPPHPHHYPAPFYPHPHPHLINSRLPANPNPNYPPPSHDVATTANTATTLYPIASSGRGFLQKHPHSSVPVSNSINPNSHLYAAAAARPGVGISYPRPVFGYSHPDPGQVPGIGMGMGYVSGRSIPHLQHPAGGGATVMPGVIKGVPISASASSQPQHKVSLSSTSIPDSNGHKEMRERGRDDSFVTIRDRKVRVSENASLYAHCRSWLRNGFSEESQPINMDIARSLPRPLPLPAQDDVSPMKKEDPKEEEEVERSVDNLTPQELLQTHIKRAKRVRSRLREERLQRIARYKTRLALLLPLMVEQQMRNDSASGN